MFPTVRAMAVTAVFSVGLLLASCSPVPESSPEMDTAGTTKVAGPTSIDVYPPETPRLTVRLTGDAIMDNVPVNLVDTAGNVVAAALTMNGIAIMDLSGVTVTPGFHRLIIGEGDSHQVTGHTVTVRDTVDENDPNAVTARSYAMVLTAEEAIILLGEGEDGGLNRVATHTIPASLAYTFSLHQNQILNISEGPGVESGMIMITDMHYSVDGEWVTITTENASALDMIGNTANKPKKTDENAPNPGIVTGKQLFSKPVDASHEGPVIAFTLETTVPVMSVTAEVTDTVDEPLIPPHG